MACRQVCIHLNDFMDGYLEPSVTQGIQEHLADCPACRKIVAAEQKFRRALRQMPVEPASDDFTERVLVNAAQGKGHDRTWWVGFSVGGGLVAALMLLLIWGLPFYGAQNAIQQLAGVTMAVNVPRTVEMVVTIPRDMEDSTITVLLPENMELDGSPGERVITWTADLRKGGNLLALPVVARRPGSSTLVARLEHGGKRKTFEVNLDVREQLSGQDGAPRCAA